MQLLERWWNDLLGSQTAMNWIEGLIILVVGFAAAAMLPGRLAVRSLNLQQRLLIRRLVRYVLVALTITGVLRALGVSLGFLLGTAGILTVAIGFAAQTSASNLISGLFLMAERPFVIGDVIRVGATTGEVTSIDLLSVRLRTFDNLLVRIPNETMLKSEVTNLTLYPIRRYDMVIGVAYRSDLRQVERVLRQVADDTPVCLQDPKPLFLVLGFADSAVQLQFSFWSTRDNFVELRNAMHDQVLRAFLEHDIEIPFPQRSVTLTDQSDPAATTVPKSTSHSGFESTR